MTATPKSDQDVLDATQQAVHSQCVVCGRGQQCSLGLCFQSHEDGSVEADFACPEQFQGYEGILHGGVVSSLLDGAMTNCLFAHGIVAVTAEMTVRFRHPIALNTPLTVSARITRRQAPLYVLEAEIVQDGVVKAKATGKFMEKFSY